MKTKAQRITIGKFCGWCWKHEGEEEKFISSAYWTTPGGKEYWLPDFLEDLDAMHRAEEKLQITKEETMQLS